MKSEFLLDKLSLPQNHPLWVAKQTFVSIKKEVHVNDLVTRVLRKRDSLGNLTDEARVLRSIGLLISMGKLRYYKGYLFKDAA